MTTASPSLPMRRHVMSRRAANSGDDHKLEVDDALPELAKHLVCNAAHLVVEIGC